MRSRFIIVYITVAFMMLTLSRVRVLAQQQDTILTTYNNQAEITARGSVTLKDGFYIPPPPLGQSVRIYIIGANCLPMLAAPSTQRNYILTTTFKEPGLSLVGQNYAACQINQSVQYFDGLGRPLQTVGISASPTGKDVIQPFDYDMLGRESITYLPYVEGGNRGTYRPNAFVDQKSFYNAPPAGVLSTGNPYSIAVYEPSPLNRIIEKGAQGAAWQPIPNSNTGHTLKTDFGTNTAIEVKRWTINAAENGAVASYYSDFELDKTTSKNENWVPADSKAGTTDEFRDLEGRMVLKRVWETDAISLNTYYIYDNFGNLRYVLPPSVNEHGLYLNSFVESDSNFNEFIYGYHYDDRKRVVEKKIPGVKFWECMIYNELDKLILSQDAAQHNNGQWLFNKYDAFGRVVVIGLYNYAGTRTSLQLMVDDQTIKKQISLWEKPVSSGIGYDNASFPQTIAYYHNINYYDDYNFPGNSFGQPTGPKQVSGNRIKGLLTGTLIAKLGSVDKLLTVKYYDDEGRVIQSKSQNHLGGTDVVDNSYSFVGELTASTRVHSPSGGGGNNIVTIANRFEYDHAGRKINTYENINNQGEILLSKLEYNEISQVKSKKLHSSNQGNTFIQTINYSYNERGWLTGINHPNTISNDKVFGMTLNYANEGAYNGNIASANWQTLVPTGLGLSQMVQTYSYRYDKLNRLKKATYSAPGANDKFNEELWYDLTGNIRSLKRKNSTGDTYLNDLNYNYIQNGQSGNKLWSVTDAGSAVQSSTYTYDDNGNQKTNSRIGITNTEYNYLNLPQTISKQSTGETINFVYDAGGSKLRKQFGNQTTDYVGGIQYRGNNIDFIMTEEGRAFPGDKYTYEYFLKDHLGNTRAVVKQDGSITQIQDYYAFGLEMNSGNSLTPSPQNNYKYNGKEKQTELGLEQYDYKARFYDPLIARFGGVDKLASSYPYKSPYDYAENRPVNGVDFDGLEWTATYNNFGMIHINVNTNFTFDVASIIPKNLSVADYQTAISKEFNDTFMLSSGGKISGSVTFNGGNEQALGRVVPSLNIFEQTPDSYGEGGKTIVKSSFVGIYNPNGSIRTPKQVAWDATHELMHTLRVEHPFVLTQGKDTQLIYEGEKNYSTTNDTDPNIYYNVMNYGMFTFNGQKLSDLWENLKTRTLTPDQIKLVLNEISLQNQGFGTLSGSMKGEFSNYWNHWPGSDVPHK